MILSQNVCLFVSFIVHNVEICLWSHNYNKQEGNYNNNNKHPQGKKQDSSGSNIKNESTGHGVHCSKSI